jgi:hypothetical protein
MTRIQIATFNFILLNKPNSTQRSRCVWSEGEHGLRTRAGK